MVVDSISSVLVTILTPVFPHRGCHVIIFFSIYRTRRRCASFTCPFLHRFGTPWEDQKLESRRFFTSSIQWSRFLAPTATDLLQHSEGTAFMIQSNPCCVSLTRDKGHACVVCHGPAPQARSYGRKLSIQAAASKGTCDTVRIDTPLISSAKPGPRSRISGYLFLALMQKPTSTSRIL